MIRQGKAVPYFIYPNFDRFEAYREALKEAVEEKRGIWNPEDPLKEIPFEFRLRVEIETLTGLSETLKRRSM